MLSISEQLFRQRLPPSDNIGGIVQVYRLILPLFYLLRVTILFLVTMDPSSPAAKQEVATYQTTMASCLFQNCQSKKCVVCISKIDSILLRINLVVIKINSIE